MSSPRKPRLPARRPPLVLKRAADPARPAATAGPPRGPSKGRDSRPPPKADRDDADDRSVLDLVLEIKEGKRNPKLLSLVDRQACVAHLCAEGLTVPEVAQFLRCSDRTVTRDRKALQESAAISHDPRLAGRIAGQLLAEAGLAMDRIRRVGRERSTPPALKLEAERQVFDVLSNLVQRLQSLGYLPTAAQRQVTDVSYRSADVPEFDQIFSEASRMVAIGAEILPHDAPELMELREVAGIAERARLASRVARASESAPCLAPQEGAPDQ